MKVKLTFKEINGLIPVMTTILQAKLPYDISFQLYQMGKTMDEANDYFVKHYNEIRESDSDTKNEDINKLAMTKVELTTDVLERETFLNALREANVKVSASDILLIDGLMTPVECEEGGFSIISEEE